MYPALLLMLVTGLVALDLIRRCRRVARAAQDKLYESQQQTQVAVRCAEEFRQLLSGYRALHLIVVGCLRRQLQEQARQHDQHNMVLLDEIGTTVLAKARTEMIADAWKSYALGYEVLCEAAAERDESGAGNASAAVTAARRVLSALGQYDA
jgi:hypothetical protein